MAARGKRQNVFADDEEQQPNDAFNKAVEAAKNAAAPKEPIAEGEAAATVAAAVPVPPPPPAPAQPAAVKPVEQPQPAAIKPVEQPQPATIKPVNLPTTPPVEQPQPAPKAERQKPDRAGAGYTKATHRIRDESFQALEDMKLALQRKYGFKRVLLEEIVEVALLGAKQDLDNHQEQSYLVQQLREHRQPESQ